MLTLQQVEWLNRILASLDRTAQLIDYYESLGNDVSELRNANNEQRKWIIEIKRIFFPNQA